MKRVKGILNVRKGKHGYNGNLKPELVFFFDEPPRVGAGAFRIVANKWGNNVYYICLNSMREERRKFGWKDCDHGDANLIILSEKENVNDFLEEFINEHINAIFIMNGFRSGTTQYIKKFILSRREVKIVAWSERPGVYGSPSKRVLKRLGLPIVHNIYSFRYKNRIKAFLPLGLTGVKTFERYGWNKDIMFPYMYDSQSNFINENKKNSGDKLRFVYVGRFSRTTKGIDVLINAFNKIERSDFTLDIVGGYGDYKDQTISWANRREQINFLGSWSSDEVSNKLTEYDVCIVPSRFDGWNVITNEAIMAGIGVIISDEAVSDELIINSGAGVVFPSGDVESLVNAVMAVINKPELAEEWKSKAMKYSHRISSENVAEYFMDVLEYTFLTPDCKKPYAPWLE